MFTSEIVCFVDSSPFKKWWAEAIVTEITAVIYTYIAQMGLSSDYDQSSLTGRAWQSVETKSLRLGMLMSVKSRETTASDQPTRSSPKDANVERITVVVLLRVFLEEKRKSASDGRNCGFYRLPEEGTRSTQTVQVSPCPAMSVSWASNLYIST